MTSTWKFVNKSTAHAKILQQSDSNSMIFTNYALKIMYMVLINLIYPFRDI